MPAPSLEEFVVPECTWNACPTCTELTAAPAGEPCWACARAADARKRRRESEGAGPYAIPPAFEWARFSSPLLGQRVGNPEAILHGRKVAQRRRVVLQGPSGLGKTSLAVAMSRARDGGAYFLPAWRISGAAFDIDDGLLGRALVILDDLGTERDIASNGVPALVFERHQRNLPFWVTTWMSAAQITDRYGDGFARRLFDGAEVINVADPEESRH